MANYVLAYKGGGEMAATEAGREAQMAEWRSWFERMGEAVVDPGNPFGPAQAIAADGTVVDGGPSGLSGYSVVKADSLDAATDLARDCPVLANGGSLEVHETIEAM